MTDQERFSGHVLVIDDDPDVRGVIVRRVQKLGASVDEATDYESAVTCLNTKRYDLILSDFNVIHGGRSGWKHGGYILKVARKAQPEVPFYFISGLLGVIDSDKQAEFVKMANGFIQKPVSREQIKEIFTKHLGPRAEARG